MLLFYPFATKQTIYFIAVLHVHFVCMQVTQSLKYDLLYTKIFKYKKLVFGRLIIFKGLI